MKSKSTKHYESNPASHKKKLEYQREYNKKPSEVARRVELNKVNRDNHAAGKSRVGDGKDVSHTKKGGTVLEKQSQNRARNRSKK